MSPIQTTGRYLVLLPDEDISSGMSALSDSTGVSSTDVPVSSRLGVAVVELDPDRLRSLTAAAAGAAPIIAVEPEQIMYAIGGPEINQETSSYLQGYKQGVSNLVDSFENGDGLAGAQRQPLTTAAFSDGATTWGLQATKVVDSKYSGAGIKVAVLDTGLDLTHPDFTGRVIDSQSFIAGEAVQDRQGHGTHCIGTACGPLNPLDPDSPRRYGVAYNAEIFVGKVLSNQGSGADGGIIGGIEWAIGKGCSIISMSLGAPVEPGTPFSPIYETLAKRALAQGTLIIAAAGNSSRRNNLIRPVGRPANSPSIMAVAAVNNQLQIAPFSDGSINLDGGQVDIAGPGVSVYSTWTTDPLPSLPWERPNPASRYKTISGTSMATPHVAGIAALYAEATGKRGFELWASLMRDAQRLPLSSADAGIGLVQAPT